MKNSYKVATVLLVSLMIAPLSSFAADNTTTATKIKKGDFCTNINNNATRITSELSKKTENVNKAKSARFKKLSDSRATYDKKLDLTREENSLKQSEKAKTLLAKANTDAKKAAITLYNSTIENAIKVRRASVDAAVKAYRDGVDSIVGEKYNKVDANVGTLKQDIDAAIATAKSSCASGVSSETAKKTMQDSIKAAHEKMKNTTTDADAKAKIKALADTRDAAIKVANTQFKTDTEKAKADLKTALEAK